MMISSAVRKASGSIMRRLAESIQSAFQQIVGGIIPGDTRQGSQVAGETVDIFRIDRDSA